MSKNWDKKLFKSMVKDGFYDIDTLKEKYGLQTEAAWYEALDELGDQHIIKIRKLINSGEDLTKNPRIKISTIHGVKGNERENVVVTTDYKIQPSKFVVENELLYPEGCAIKYIIRHRDKNGKEDILKAIHFLEMILERDYEANI
jgi:hypothetical protein